MNSGPDNRQTPADEAVDLFVIAQLAKTNQHRAFDDWRAADACNVSATESLMEIWNDVADLKARPSYSRLYGTLTLRERIVEAIDNVFGEPWLTPIRLSVGVACLTLAFFSAIYLSRAFTPEFETQVAEVRELPLVDGSRVTLGARSVIQKVSYSVDSRRVQMGLGEAFFSVAKNKGRPFFVQVGKTLIRVVGTKFNVKYDGVRVKVSVVEGVVDVIRPGRSIKTMVSANGLPHVTLTAGEQTIVQDESAGFQSKVSRIEGSIPGAWREGHLTYSDAELSEVIADVNRYRTGQVRIASPELAREPITTSFSTAQTDQLLDTLSVSIGAQIVRFDDGSVEIRRP